MGFISKGVATAMVVLAVVFSLSSVTAALAHAPIKPLRWDDPMHPTKLIATSIEDDISKKAGTFYLKIYDSQGKQVDRGDTAVISATEMSVSVQPNLPVGQYRVDWKTASADDGDSADGSLTIAIVAPGTPPVALPATAPAPIAIAAAPAPAGVPATHDHSEMVMDDHHDDDHDAAMAMPALPSRPATFETRLSGANIVPTRLSSPASAFARFTFNPANSQLSYTVWVSGISANLIDGLHVHRGSALENGVHAFDILTAGPTDKLIFTGSAVLPAEDVARLLSGNLYLMLHTKEYPTGAARGQLVLPSQAAAVSAPRPVIAPPRTGDAGLIGAYVAGGVRD